MKAMPKNNANQNDNKGRNQEQVEKPEVSKESSGMDQQKEDVKPALHTQIDYAKLEEINKKFHDDAAFRQEFRANPEESLKNEGFVLPEGMKVRYDDAKTETKFELRLGGLVISE